MAAPERNISVEDVLIESLEDPASYFHGQALRLLLTYRNEGGLQNIQKAQFCLDKLIQLYGRNNNAPNNTR